MPTTLPVAALTVIGILLVVLGLFAAGSLELIVLGVVAVAIAGVLQVAGARHS